MATNWGINFNDVFKQEYEATYNYQAIGIDNLKILSKKGNKPAQKELKKRKSPLWKVLNE